METNTKIRKKIFRILLEICDYKKIRDNLIIGRNYYSFIRNDENYGVIFSNLSGNRLVSMGLNNKTVKNAIRKSNKIFQVDFGTLDDNGKIETERNTNFFDYEYVLGSISAIIEYFMTENQVDVLVYFAEKKRRNIYKNIYEKFFKNNFYYFEKTEITNGKYEIFFIKNDLLK